MGRASSVSPIWIWFSHTLRWGVRGAGKLVCLCLISIFQWVFQTVAEWMNECAALMNGTGSANSCIRCRDWSLNSLHLLLPCGRYYLPASSLHWRHMLWFCFVLPNCDPYKSHTHTAHGKSSALEAAGSTRDPFQLPAACWICSENDGSVFGFSCRHRTVLTEHQHHF